MDYTHEGIRHAKRKNEKRKKILSAIAYAILLPILVYNIILIIQTIANPNETPSVFGVKTYIIISGSMEPQINIGDVVVVKKVEREELNIGDIISFRQGQSVITHRIEDILGEGEEKEYKTKGDNNNTEDLWVLKYSDIEGKVINQIPKIGKVAIILQNVFTIIIIAIIFFIYTVHSGNKRRKQEIRNIKRKRYENKKGS